MPKSPNCTGAPLYKGRVDVSITYPSPDETLLTTPVDLPTSEPAEAQISYTLGSQHMPTWSPYELEHVKSAILYALGKNASGSSVSIYYRVLKNGVSVATGSQVRAAGSYYLWSHYQFFDVQSGDVLECKLWAGAAGCNWDGKAVLVYPTRIGPKGEVLLDVGTPTIESVYGLTIANYGMLSSLVLYPFSVANSSVSWFQGGVAGAIQTHRQSGLGIVVYSDRSLGSAVSGSTTNRGTWYGNSVPSRIVYTPSNLRV